MDTELKKSKVFTLVKGQATGNKPGVNLSGKSMSRIKVRRQSYGFSSIAGAAASVRSAEHRSSQAGIEFKRPPLVFLNTYQLDTHYKFNEAHVLKVAETILDDAFDDHQYNVQESPIVAMRIAAEIMRDVKAMGFNRYRIICVVTLAQKRAQSYNNAVAFLWDHERDLYADVQREVTTAFIHVTVFGVYLD